ncbi:hypothetical protein [Sphingomonas sp.]|uniref:hypothetical protein n=1 Tax=Sphingomonas sp. TaxID=28214 RepID=UPI001B213177|nr:hypothetical protein [Sphingomonas sp.]MBO9714501.1 hypothetical protein [Sphingomonas sp.]
MNRWRMMGWGAAAGLLALPLAAMQVTREVDWGVEDFLVFGTMILAAGVALELALRASGNPAYRLGAAVAVAGAFLLVWANLAVGFIGEPADPLNLIFAGVLAVGIGAAGAARFRAAGMAVAMAATAGAQALTALAMIGHEPRLFAIDGAFVAIWLVSAALFRKAARDEGVARLA